MKKFIMAFLVLGLCLAIVSPVLACFIIGIGKDASPTGYPILAHNDDIGGNYYRPQHGWVPARSWPAGTTLPMEAGRAAIPQVPYTPGLYYWQAKGIGRGSSTETQALNHYGVQVCTNSNASSKLNISTPSNPLYVGNELVDGGIEYNLRRIAGERATSARHGAEIIMEMLNAWGYAQSGRAYTIGDYKEIWMVQVAMGKNKYVATRLPDDHIMIMPNFYTMHNPNLYASDGPYADKGAEVKYDPYLLTYAISTDLFSPDRDGDFDFAKVYQADSTYLSAGNTFRHAYGRSIIFGDTSFLPTEDFFRSGSFSANAAKSDWAVSDDVDFSFSYKVPAGMKISMDTIRKVMSHHFEGSLQDPLSLRTAPGSSPHLTSIRRICTGTTMESKIVQFHPNPLLVTQWLAYGRPCTLPYTPLHPIAVAGRLPDLQQMKDPAKTLANHLIAESDRPLYPDTAFQKFREFQAMMDLMYNDCIDEVSVLLANFFTEMQAENQAFVAAGDVSSVLAFDQDVHDRALKMLQDYMESKELFGIHVEAETYLDRTDSTQTNMNIYFKLPVGKVPNSNDLYIHFIDRDGSSTSHYFRPASNALENLGNGLWKTVITRSFLLGSNGLQNTEANPSDPGEYGWVIGGRTEGGEAFAGIFKILFTDGGDLYSVKFYGYDGDWVELKSQIVEKGRAAIPPYKVPKISDHTFVGWTPDYSNISDNMTFYAQYEPALVIPGDGDGDDHKHNHNFKEWWEEHGCNIGISLLAVIAIAGFMMLRRKF